MSLAFILQWMGSLNLEVDFFFFLMYICYCLFQVSAVIACKIKKENLDENEMCSSLFTFGFLFPVLVLTFTDVQRLRSLNS